MFDKNNGIISIIFMDWGMNMKTNVVHRLMSVLLTVFFVFCSCLVASAKEDTAKNRYYLGEAVKTGWDNGYSGEEKIKEGDVHFNWKMGEFFVDGYSSVQNGDDDVPVFLKNVGDKVQLWFNLQQDINKLNNDENLTVSEDSNGADEYFSIPKTDFKRGALIIQKTGYNNAKEKPLVYTDYLAAKLSKDADTKVELCEEGDYEVALDYEIKSTPRKIFDLEVIPEFSNYRIFFKFSVRNGNCMVYPFDVKTKGELTNTSITENGFYLDFANSRYLDINVKKEVMNEGATGLAEDVRFNRPAKDGEQYTDEGIYTITASNKYTGQLTTKKIYVGTDDVLKAVVATGLTVSDIKKYIEEGATIGKDGSITLASNKTIEPLTEPATGLSSAQSTDKQAKKSTQDSAIMSFITDNLKWVIIGCAAFVVVLLIVIIVAAKKRKKKKNLTKENKTSDEEPEEVQHEKDD